MLKKILLGALVAVSTFGMFSVSEAHHGNYDCRDGCCYKNYCCGNYYNDEGDNYGCYGGNGWCGRGWNNN